MVEKETQEDKSLRALGRFQKQDSQARSCLVETWLLAATRPP